MTAYDEAKRKGYRHPECVEAAIKAAPPAQPAERGRCTMYDPHQAEAIKLQGMKFTAIIVDELAALDATR